ncbi:MAG TPA: alpha/beta hydrolase [Flavitalea sp.]|nr:alpha/beta hydrolase [Flavitalea sp.]
MKIKTGLFKIILVALLFLAGGGLSNAQPGVAQVNGIRIAYHSYGTKNKEVILMISGTNAQLTMWPAPLCDKLVKNGYRVIVFDNRDIGLSTKFDNAGQPDWAAITKALETKQKPPLPYSLDDMAKDAVALLDALGIKKAHIVGASMGGMIAQRVAYYHPEHVLSLTSIMAGGGKAIFPLVAKPDVFSKIPPAGANDDTATYLHRELQSMKILAGDKYPVSDAKATKLIRSNMKRSFHPNGLVRQGAASLAAFYAGRSAELGTIKAPSLIIHGTEDPLVTIDAAKDVAATIPGARMEVIEGMGHDIPEPLYDKFAELIVSNAKSAKSAGTD